MERQESGAICRQDQIGVLLFNSGGQKLLGDPGFKGTFPFPVTLGYIEGSYQDVIKPSPEVLAKIIHKAQELVNGGAAAIAGDCGLMAIYQKQISDEIKVPFIASSLILIPLIRKIIAESLPIGVITGHSGLLGKEHLKAAGIDKSFNLVFQGMEEENHFNQAVIQGSIKADYELMKNDILSAMDKLIQKEREIGGILLECSNLASFSHEIYKRYKIPVFDINLAIVMLKQAVYPKEFFIGEA